MNAAEDQAVRDGERMRRHLERWDAEWALKAKAWEDFAVKLAKKLLEAAES
jgi:hypothetical protein